MNSAQNGDSPFLKLENGENRVRIVSEMQGVKEHRIETPESCTMTACPKEMLRWQVETTGQDQGGKLPPCPICEAMEKDEKKAQNWRPRTQYLAVALNRKDGKVGVLKKGKTVFAPLTSYNEDPDWGDVRKYDVKIMKSGEGLATTYQVIPVPQKSETAELTNEEKARVMDFDVNLDQMTTPLPYEKIVEKIGATLTSELPPQDIASDDIPF